MARREQFSIPQATPAYEEMVQQLPSEFVGPASSKPPALVTALSTASCLSTQAAGLSEAVHATGDVPTVLPSVRPVLHILRGVWSAGLVPLVQLLCAEMSHAFEVRSMTCPPWRQAKAMLSKWLPAKVRHRYGTFWCLSLLMMPCVIVSYITGAEC